jgi:SAM-dependent methyltransferase
MHLEAKSFTLYVKTVLSQYFENKRVLDVGSGDINGNNKFLFHNCDYNGNDVYQAPNVTIVSPTSKLPFAPEIFDTIISTECFEHDPEYAQSFQKIVSMLKPGGLFTFTCASTGRAEHGTRHTSPHDSYGTIGNIEGWTDYYKNLTFEDLAAAIPVNEIFSSYSAYYNSQSKDLYFFGIRKGSVDVLPIINDYTAQGVSLTHKYTSS